MIFWKANTAEEWQLAKLFDEDSGEAIAFLNYTAEEWQIAHKFHKGIISEVHGVE